MIQHKAEKWFSNDTAQVKDEKVMPLKGVCYAVYPDTVRMGLSSVNTCVAVFKYKDQAIDFGNSMWQDKWMLKEVSL
jgi:hypothetical protein